MNRTSTRGNKCGAALLAFSLLLAGMGCAHRELTAPCVDYKAANFDMPLPPRTIPCDRPQHMPRPPWVMASAPAAPSAQEG